MVSFVSCTIFFSNKIVLMFKVVDIYLIALFLAFLFSQICIRIFSLSFFFRIYNILKAFLS
jgi:hypothetical protein